MIGQGPHYFRKFWNLYVTNENGAAVTIVQRVPFFVLFRADLAMVIFSLICLGLEVNPRFVKLAIVRPLKLLRFASNSSTVEPLLLQTHWDHRKCPK